MNVYRAGVAVLLLWVLPAGCAQSKDPFSQYHLGTSRDVVSRSIEATGGLDAWRNLGRIDATALVTTYQNGEPFTHQEKLAIDLKNGSIDARSSLPQGAWRVVADEDGKSDVQGALVGDSHEDQIVEALTLLAHRMRGPLNVLLYGDRPADCAKVRVPGVDEDLVRVGVVPVKGRSDAIQAYYFDADTGLLKYVTTGADRPGGQGAVTIYSYKKLPSGLVFPAQIQVMKIGQYVLVGQTPVLDVKFSNITIP